MASSADASAGSPPDDATVTDVDADRRILRRDQWIRRGVLTAFAVFVLLGLLNVFGDREATNHATADGMQLAVVHPAVTRPGLAVPFRIEVESEDGFDEQIVIRVDRAFLATIDENGIDPDPDGSTATPDYVEFEFTPPDDNRFEFSIDARVGPGERGRVDGWVEVVGTELPRVTFTTLIIP